MTEVGCLGFPKVVLKRPKREQLRDTLIGIWSWFIQQSIVLRDGLKGPPSNPRFLAWFLMHLGSNRVTHC